jgi:hypothetical protein
LWAAGDILGVNILYLAMNRKDFQNLAEERLADAQVLVTRSRFGAA